MTAAVRTWAWGDLGAFTARGLLFLFARGLHYNDGHKVCGLRWFVLKIPRVFNP